MNPYLLQLMEVEEKMALHYRNKVEGVNPYVREADEIAGKLIKWDEQRKTAVKESNNESISEIAIKIEDDDDDVFFMILCPRVRLFYNRKSGPILDPLELASTLRMLLIWPEYSKKPVFIDLDDVKSDDYCKTIAVYVRDLSFIPLLDNSLPIYSKIAIARQFLLRQNLNPLTVFYGNRPDPNLVYDLVDSPPPDDPISLVHDFDASYPGYMDHRRPVIVVYGLVPAFPSTSNKSTHLLQFFSSFGIVRFFNIQLDTVSVEYEVQDDFLVALNTLCCCSIRKDGSHELFDFDIVLKRPLLGENEKEVGKKTYQKEKDSSERTWEKTYQK
ncbi:uncharacterized protein LOC141592607 [Silene latifolia]|uniref:uncharacterized protein LOC141592607 n=1 Tax=Silene latifolia TaxID=37657 RepID=UPI003D786A35